MAAVAAAALLAAATPASAQDNPVDVGVIKKSDRSVVQKMLYQKEGRIEAGAFLGWMPFDTFTTTPVAGINGGYHLNEEWGAELAINGGLAMENYSYRLLSSEAYGISPDAYGHMLGISAHALWSPIYAKFSWRGKKVVHHDVYALGGTAFALEKALMPDASTAFSPGVALGMGMRFYLNRESTLRVQVKDDLLIQSRVKTEESQSKFLKQNVAVTVGYTRLIKGK
jgi:outer membrane beta-barrel protein